MAVCFCVDICSERMWYTRQTCHSASVKRCPNTLLSESLMSVTLCRCFTQSTLAHLPIVCSTSGWRRQLSAKFVVVLICTVCTCVHVSFFKCMMWVMCVRLYLLCVFSFSVLLLACMFLDSILCPFFFSVTNLFPSWLLLPWQPISLSMKFLFLTQWIVLPLSISYSTW